MGKIDVLIQQYCPDGIPYKTLGELGKFYGGLTGKSKEDFKEEMRFLLRIETYIRIPL